MFRKRPGPSDSPDSSQSEHSQQSDSSFYSLDSQSSAGHLQAPCERREDDECMYIIVGECIYNIDGEREQPNLLFMCLPWPALLLLFCMNVVQKTHKHFPRHLSSRELVVTTELKGCVSD